MIVSVPRAPDAPLVASLTVNLTQREKDAVKKSAKAAGLSMSAWARRAMTARLR